MKKITHSYKGIIILTLAIFNVSTLYGTQKESLDTLVNGLAPSGVYSYLNDKLAHDPVGKMIAPLVDPLMIKLTSAESPLTADEKKGLQAFYHHLQEAKKHPTPFDKKKMNADLVSPALLRQGQMVLGRLMDDQSQFLSVTEKVGVGALQLSLDKALRRKGRSQSCAP